MVKVKNKDLEKHIHNAIHPTFAGKEKHLGMPEFDDSGPALSFYEFWSTKFFYIPVAIHLAYLCLRHTGLTLPTIANPLFPMGGYVGESKKDIFKQFNEEISEFTVSFTHIERSDDLDFDVKDLLAKMKSAGIDFPAVIKPDVGCRGVGVQLLRDKEAVREYLSAFPIGGLLVVQELVPYEGEAGIFYIREPDADSGRIFSITLKYFPYVVGDGVSSLRQLIENDRRAGQIKHVYLRRHESILDDVIPEGQNFRLAFTGSHSRGTIFRNGNEYITDAMLKRFDMLSHNIPEFYFGRFDVRFSDYRELQKGRGFKIVEINGAGAEATHIWDRRTGLFSAYGVLFEQNSLLFRIAAKNRKRGFRASSVWGLLKAYLLEKRLTRGYPHTE